MTKEPASPRKRLPADCRGNLSSGCDIREKASPSNLSFSSMFSRKHFLMLLTQAFQFEIAVWLPTYMEIQTDKFSSFVISNVESSTVHRNKIHSSRWEFLARCPEFRETTNSTEKTSLLLCVCRYYYYFKRDLMEAFRKCRLF